MLQAESGTLGDANPVSGPGRLALQLSVAQNVSVRVFDALGREVSRAHDGPMSAGSTSVEIATSALAPGVYVVRVDGEGVREGRRFTVVR